MTTSTLPAAPLTALDAVNQMLQSIGQGKINALSVSASVDATNAMLTLTNTTREVQTRGWWFNVERGYPMSANTEGSITIPSNCLKFIPDRTCGCLVVRGGRLYDNRNHTFYFAPPYTVTGEAVWHLPFDDLPDTARQYITRRAGREFQIGAVGSDLLYKFTKEMEVEAETEVMREHLRVMRPNAIHDSYGVHRVATAARLRGGF